MTVLSGSFSIMLLFALMAQLFMARNMLKKSKEIDHMTCKGYKQTCSYDFKCLPTDYKFNENMLGDNKKQIFFCKMDISNSILKYQKRSAKMRNFLCENIKFLISRTFTSVICLRFPVGRFEYF